jgi:hypothetical protein
MGEGAKKKRLAAAKAAKKDKAKQLSEALAGASTNPTSSDVPTQSKAGNSKKSDKAPRVPPAVESVPTRQSTRSLATSSKLISASANLEGTDNGKPRPKRAATAAAVALLQELQLSDTEETEETERDPDGVFTGNVEIDKMMELEEDDDDGTGDDEGDGSDGSDIEVIEHPVARKGVLKVSAVGKKPNLRAIEENESSSDESGKCVCQFL